MRLLLIFGVVINHIGSTKIITDLPALTSITSPGLAVISGFLLMRNLNSFSTLVKRVRKRITTLIIPYLAWTILYFIFIRIVTKMLMQYGIHFPEFDQYALGTWSFETYFYRFFLYPTPGAFWYLQNLILALPLSFLLLPILRFRYLLVPVLLFLWITFFLGIHLFFSSQFLPFFIVGLWLGIHYPNLVHSSPYSTKVTLGIFFILFIIIRLLVLENKNLENLIKFPLEFGALYALFFSLRNSQSSKFVDWLNAKNHIAFFLHSFHQILFWILGGCTIILVHYMQWSIHPSIMTQSILTIIFLGLVFHITEYIEDFVSRHSTLLSDILNGTRGRGSY